MIGLVDLDEFSENFQKGGGAFPIQKIMLQIFAIINGNAVTNLREKAQHRYPKRGGGSKAVWTLSENSSSMEW